MALATLDRPRPPTSAEAGRPPRSVTTIDEEEAIRYASWFKVLAEPTRLRILHLLARHDEPVCVCDIVDQFPLGQPAISHHLKLLRDARFVLSERRGTFIYYRVNPACLSVFPEAARRILDPKSSP